MAQEKRKKVSPSAVDCICCGLGATLLLWFATVASNRRKSNEVESVLVLSITAFYPAAPYTLATSSQLERKQPIETWSFNGSSLARFYEDGAIEPDWIGWPKQGAAKNGEAYFAPNEEGLELITFMSERLNTDASTNEFTWTRTLAIQNAMRVANGDLQIEFFENSLPTYVVVTASCAGNEKSVPKEERAGLKTISISVDGSAISIKDGK